MKKSILVFVIMLLSGVVFADNLYQSNNPFPQTMPQSLNNIYESAPAVMQHEEKQEKKSWFRKNKKTKEVIDNTQNELQAYPLKEGQSDGSFYVFK